jgi:hypothetical protein
MRTVTSNINRCTIYAIDHIRVNSAVNGKEPKSDRGITKADCGQLELLLLETADKDRYCRDCRETSDTTLASHDRA